MPDRDPRVDPHRLQTRTVEVDEPQLSAATNREMTADLRDVIGADHVDVPADRPHPSRGEQAARAGARGLPLPRNMVVTMLGASLLIVAVIIGLTGAGWWLLPVAIVLLGLVTYVVLEMILRMTTNSERPSATTVAAMEAGGVHDPEQLFSDIVAEFTEDPGSNGENERNTSTEDDPVKAAAEQRSAITPSGGATRPVGPGS